MKKIISESNAAIALLAILIALVIFHFFVMIDIIPYQMIWGGRIENKRQLIKIELISIIVNLIMILVIMIKKRLIRFSINPRYLQLVLWIMFVFFLLNTLGNMLSLNQVEKILFAPLTFLLSFFTLRLAISK